MNGLSSWSRAAICPETILVGEVRLSTKLNTTWLKQRFPESRSCSNWHCRQNQSDVKETTAVRGLDGSNPPRSCSQSGLCPSLATAAENCRIRAGLCQSKGTGERTNSDYQGDLRQFLSVRRRAGSRHIIFGDSSSRNTRRTGRWGRQAKRRVRDPDTC
jgi:hypothetical protein